MPRWLQIQYQVDYYLWELNNMLKAEINLSNFERMIDEATGFSKKKLQQAKYRIAKIKKLMKEYNDITA